MDSAGRRRASLARSAALKLIESRCNGWRIDWPLALPDELSCMAQGGRAIQAKLYPINRFTLREPGKPCETPQKAQAGQAGARPLHCLQQLRSFSLPSQSVFFGVRL